MPRTCLKCNHQAEAEIEACPNCGAVYAKLQRMASSGHVIRAAHVVTDADREAARIRAKEAEQTKLRSAEEMLAHARQTGNWAGFPADVVEREISAIILSTTESIPGRTIEEICGVIGGEYAVAFGAIFETIAGAARNLAGTGKSGLTLHHMQTGRQEALQSLRMQALNLGANSVVAIRFDFEEFSGANQRGVLVVAATGTAVRLAAAR